MWRYVYIYMWKYPKPMHSNFSYDILFRIWMVVCKWDWNNEYIVLEMSLFCTCIDPPWQISIFHNFNYDKLCILGLDYHATKCPLQLMYN
jgi:hypothetical protein